MYHEATACHVTGDLIDMLSLILDITKCLQKNHEQKKLSEKETPRTVILTYKEWPDLLRKLVTLLNTYNPKEMRQSVLGNYNLQISIHFFHLIIIYKFYII